MSSSSVFWKCELLRMCLKMTLELTDSTEGRSGIKPMFVCGRSTAVRSVSISFRLLYEISVSAPELAIVIKLAEPDDAQFI
jgi:hypothetical protein